MKKGGALIRVSTPGQKENTSPENQIIQIKRACEEHGFTLDERHIWFMAESGKKRLEDRKGMDKARQAVENKEIQRIYIYNVKRLSRNMTSGLLFIEEMTRNGCEVYNIATKKVLSRYDLGFLIDLMLAEKDGNDIVFETYQGLKQVVREGKYSGGIVAYGYQLNPRTKELDINEEEAQVVRLIFRLCVEDCMTCQRIATYLNGRGYQTKYQRMPNPEGKRKETSGHWRAGRIRSMIVNTAYYGLWQWGKHSVRPDKEIIDSACKPIVTKEIWDAAQRVLVGHRLSDPTATKRKYLLRGLIKCKYCHKSFCGYYSNISRGRERSYYKCNGRTQLSDVHPIPCDSPSLIGEKVEDFVWNDVREYCRHPETIVANLRRRRDEIHEAELHQELEGIKKSFVELDKQLRNFLIIQSKSERVSSKMVDELIADVEQEKELLHRRESRIRIQLDTRNQIDESITDFEEFLSKMQSRIEDATWEEKRELIIKLVDKIEASYIEKDGKQVPHLDIYYRFQKPEFLSSDSVIIAHTGMG